MDRCRLTVADEDAMRRLAAKLADAWRMAGHPPGMVALEGDLGAGKSFFARAFIRHMMGDAAYPVPSPTFTLVQPYELPGGHILWHADLYRLEQAGEAEALGLREAFDAALVLVEWPERLAPAFPEDMLRLAIAIQPDSDAREITLSAEGSLTSWMHQLRTSL